MREVQGREGNFDVCGPPIACDVGVRRPNAIPSRIKIGAGAAALLLDDQAVYLRAERIDFEHVRATPIMVGVDKDFEVVI